MSQSSQGGEMSQSSQGGEELRLGVLVHNEGDEVGVAIRDLESGDVLAGWLDSERRAPVVVAEPVPFGHKVALVDIDEGANVTEYSVRIGLSRHRISRGELVHVHNLRSARWQQSD